MNPRLDLVVGCNGAGKSTFITTFLQPRLPNSPFVNADVIAKEMWPDDPEGQSYAAAKIAEGRRNTLITQGRSMIAETVFSQPSMLELIGTAQANGFRVILHVVMVPEDEAVLRVAARVADGGHSVPEEKIRERYRRLWSLVATAITQADRAFVYDNSADVMVNVARFVAAIPEPGTRESWPTWTPEPLRALTEG